MNLLRCGWQSVAAPPPVRRQRDDNNFDLDAVPSSSQMSSYETLLIKQVRASSRKNLLVNRQSSATFSNSGNNNNINSHSTNSTRAKRHSNSFEDTRPHTFSPLAFSRPSKSSSHFLPFQYWHQRGGIGKSNPSASSYYYQSDVTKSLIDSEEIAIPEQSVGLYQFFCQPSTWSPAFASPGDFTIKISAVFVRANEIQFRIGVICCCIKTLRDGVRFKEVSKRKSYVFHLDRSESQLMQFVEAIALQYIGHRFATRLPKTSGLARIAPFTCRQTELDAYGERVQNLLSELLSTTEIGFNRLVILDQPPIKNVLVREFFEVGMPLSEPTMKMTTSSCDARIERKYQRPLLPSSWIVKTKYSGDDAQDVMESSLPHPHGRLHHPPHEELAVTPSPPHDALTRLNHKRTSQPSGNPTLHCVHFIPPNRWHVEKFADGAFTVELSGVSNCGDHACFCISVLHYNSQGRLEHSCVDRRFAEFVALAKCLETKVTKLHVIPLLPSKTIVRQLDALFLEKRAELLQIFLEKLLVMRFRGLLDQTIPMIAEPNVRTFLCLPRVEWSVVPRNKRSRGHSTCRHKAPTITESDLQPRLPRATSASASDSTGTSFPLFFHNSAPQSDEDPIENDAENDNQSIERLGTSFSPEKMVMFASPPIEFCSDLLADKHLLSLRSRSGIETTGNNAIGVASSGYRSFSSRARSDSF